ncbi:hypothetical protein MNBD_BACTEROID03-2550 [hydrothermal vent metagenome]|uniref:Uncharacterized protein n=1 Tax=hydrothermal vent metagenome TaxID=652676 RepID=A0A3B0SXP3_9ZZZZ
MFLSFFEKTNFLVTVFQSFTNLKFMPLAFNYICGYTVAEGRQDSCRHPLFVFLVVATTGFLCSSHFLAFLFLGLAHW